MFLEENGKKLSVDKVTYLQKRYKKSGVVYDKMEAKMLGKATRGRK